MFILWENSYNSVEVQWYTRRRLRGLVREDSSCDWKKLALAVNRWSYSWWEILRMANLGRGFVSQNMIYRQEWQVTWTDETRTWTVIAFSRLLSLTFITSFLLHCTLNKIQFSLPASLSCPQSLFLIISSLYSYDTHLRISWTIFILLSLLFLSWT